MAMKSAWGIEIGAYAIKALRLERDGDQVSVTDFAVIPHKRVLTTPDLDQDEMVRLSLGQFISQKDLEGEHLVMSVPGHSAFARFAKLPPVEPKKVPDIVKFEAVQQIPFPIDQVEWDYETFTSEDTPEIEVGIFAITRDRVQQKLELYGELGVSPEAMTLSPVAVYNAMAYDLNLKSEADPVIFLDIGTQATDVVIVEKGRCWIRTFPLGGTHFTEAIANAFKLSYSKAEKLKQEASSSKYAKQIMQAMRPVFSDLLQDLQRSIGYYQSLHREQELKTMIGLGSTFKIPGLRKYLGQQLQLNVARLDEYKRISVAGREAASFAENAVNMATAYGLALQGTGRAAISVNLVPTTTLREQIWLSKTKWFGLAAAIAIVGSSLTLYRPITDGMRMDPGGEPAEVRQAIDRARQFVNEYQQFEAGGEAGHTMDNMMRLTEYREIWPYLLDDAAAALASSEPQQALLSNDPEQIRSVSPQQRRLVELVHLRGDYSYNSNEDRRRIAVTMNVRLSHESPDEFLTATVATWLRSGDVRPGHPYRIVTDSVSINPREIQRRRVEGEDDTDRGRDAGDQPGRGGGRGGFGGASGGRSGGPGGMIGGGPGDSGGRGPAGDGGGDGRAERGDLDEMAPIPNRPRLMPPGSEYFLAKITFEIELIPTSERGQVPADQAGTPDVPADREESAS